MAKKTGCGIRRLTLFDAADSPDGLLEGERRERLLLLVKELMRRAACGTPGGGGRETRDE